MHESTLISKKLRGSALLAMAQLIAMSMSVEAIELKIAGDEDSRRVEIRVNDQTLMTSPDEGLWSIATEWKNGWPSGWRHVVPSTTTREGDWTILTGKLTMDDGVMELRDAYRIEDGVVRAVRRYRWRSDRSLPRATLAIRWRLPEAKRAQLTLPGIVYYGNPSGKRTGSHAVIVHDGEPGDETYCEEHRFSSPWACLEWKADGNYRCAALHTIPSLVQGGNRDDQWWSLGAAVDKQGTELAVLSGPCAANRRRSVAKALQGSCMAYPDAWMDVPPGAVIEKTFYLEAAPDVVQGSGFRKPLKTAMRLHVPPAPASLPSYDRIVRDKYRFALSRYHDANGRCGFKMYPSASNSRQIVMGWCGQAETVGYAMLGLADRIADPDMIGRGVKALDLLASSPFNEHGFHIIYDADRDKWSGQDPVSAGQAMEGFARAIVAGRRLDGVDTERWERFLRQACDFHARRILKNGWKPINTAEAFFISPLCKAARLFGDENYEQAAVKAGKYYANRHLSMEEPYWGGTLDARCEDKEGAWAAFQAFLALYELTNDERYLRWAEHAMDVVLTYTVLWDIPLVPGRLSDHGFKAAGWTIVSAQNQHLDVYGVLYAPELWRMGDCLKREDLKRLAVVMYRACGQMIDPFGSQGEQIQHTNFAQRGDLSAITRLRGGYSEDWTVLWITAHFLNAAAEFERMGVDLDQASAL